MQFRYCGNIVTDNGVQFLSVQFKEFFNHLGVCQCKTAIFNLQANGVIVSVISYIVRLNTVC